MYCLSFRCGSLKRREIFIKYRIFHFFGFDSCDRRCNRKIIHSSKEEYFKFMQNVNLPLLKL